MKWTPYDLALHHLFDPDVEGGLGHIKGDPGGLTYKGISTPAWNSYLTKVGKPKRAVSTATEEDIRDFYRKGYWDRECCELVPAWAAMLTFDVGVHSGPTAGTKALQSVLCVSCDGVVGHTTLGRLNDSDPVDVIRSFCDARARTLHAIDKKRYQGRLSVGFNKRIRRLHEHALLTYLGVSPWKVI